MGKQRQKRFCGQCAQCLVNKDCGKCIFCLNKKLWKKKCELRRCQVYEKVPRTTHNAQDCETKWTFTLQLSNHLLEACYNLEHGSETHISGTVYEDATIYRDNDKLTIKLEDSSNIVYTRAPAGEPHHHSLVDIAFTEDSWTTRKPNQRKPRPIETFTNTSVKLDSIDDLNYDTSYLLQGRKIVEENNVSLNDDLEVSETMLVNFTDENTCRVEVKKELSDTIFNNEEFENQNYEHRTSKKEKFSRPRRKISKSMIYKEESSSNAEEEGSDVSFKATKHSKKKICHKVNVKCEPGTSNDGYFVHNDQNCHDDELIGDQKSYEALETNEENSDTDEYTVSSNDEGEIDSHYDDSTDIDDPMENEDSFKRKASLYTIKIKCPSCTSMCKYSRSGILRHLKSHVDVENRFELITQLKQNILNWEKLEGNILTCEFCNKELCDVFYPLHIQWEHSERNFKKSHFLLQKYFETVKSSDELSSEDIIKDYNMSVTLQQDTTLNLDTRNCKHCGKVFGKSKLSKHMKKCARNPKTNREAVKKHRRICRSRQNIYLIKIKCPICSILYKYSRTGIIRHIREKHKKEDAQFNLQQNLRQNMIDWAEVKDEMMCEFCNRNLSKASYPLHIQWEHSEQNLEKSRDSLANYFASVMTVDELNSKYTAMKRFIMTVAEEDSSTDDLQSGTNIYIMKMKCSLCDIKFQYNETGVLKHIEECHSDVDNKLELFTEMKQNMTDLTNLEEDHLSCEFCGTACKKAFLPLHIQWEHSENHFERSQDILATFFNEVLSIDELQCESIIKDYGMTVTAQETTAVNLETSSCEYCCKVVGKRKMSTHHKSCCKNPQRELLSHAYQCKCGFRSSEISFIKEHKIMCKKGRAYLIKEGTTICKNGNTYFIKVPCPVCSNSYKYSRESVIRHIKEHHKDTPNNLELIRKLIKTIADWESTEGETLTCEICDKIWSKIYYPLHVQWKHSDRNVERCRVILCNYFENLVSVNEFCDVEMYKNFDLSVAVIENYAKSFDTGTCEHCGIVIHKRKLTNHLNNCIKNPQRKIFYHCECGFKSSEIMVIKDHRRACKRDPVICDICGKKMKSKSHYFKHRKFDHGIVSARGTAIKNYPCEDCDEVFQLPSRLRIHRIRRHSDERNYICEFCSRAYKFPTALKNHIQFAHNNVYKFYCEKCGHGMNKKSLVKTHVCGRTRRRLKLHEKWMKKLDDKDCDKRIKPTKLKNVKKYERKPDDLVNQQNEGNDYTANQESSEQYFTASSEIHGKYGSPSSVTHHSLDITSHLNLRQSVSQTESIFPLQSSYVNLQPSVLPGYQYPPFISNNETLPSSSGYDMSNYHMS